MRAAGNAGKPSAPNASRKNSIYAQMAAAQRSAAQQRLVLLLGPVAEPYLRQLANTDRSLTRQVRELFELIRDYGPEAVAGAVQKTHTARAFGADYIANILRQQQGRREVQPRFASANRS